MSGETVTRHAFLALRDEHGFIKEGFDFLDEKRQLLAQRILVEHAAYRVRRDALAEAWASALVALANALGEGGLLALSVAAPPRIHLELPERQRLTHFGVALLDAELATQDAPDASSGLQRRCAVAFVHVTHCATSAAATAGNLHRLIAEYRRTDRRARALENVILPEIRSDLAMMEEHLDLNDQEEVIRVHTLRR